MAAHITNDFRLPSCPVTSAARATHELMKAVSCNSLAPGPGRLPGPTRSTSRAARGSRASRDTVARARAQPAHACEQDGVARHTPAPLAHLHTPPCTSSHRLQQPHAPSSPPQPPCASFELQSWTVSSLERPHAESSSPAMRLVGQGGRQHHCKVTNYEFERVAHTELHTPGLLVTRRGARSCPGWSATRSAAVAEPA